MNPRLNAYILPEPKNNRVEKTWTQELKLNFTGPKN